MIKKRAVNFPDPERYKIHMSEECKDFISKLLAKDPNQRLGRKGGQKEVLAHPWFKSLNVDTLMKKKMTAPYKPTLSKNKFDVTAFDKEFTQEEAKVTIASSQ